MSDHDRGAYTPNNEAPLSFDARQSRGRRAFPTTLLISLVILIGLTLAIFMFYRSGVRGAGEAPTPVGTPVGEIKSPPTQAQQQQAQEAGQGLTIYKAEGNAEAGVSSAPAAGFAPPPEQPQARPVAPVAAQPIAPAQTAPAKAAPAPVVAAAPAPASPPAAPPPAQVAQAKPAPAAAPVKAAPAKPAVAASKAPPKDEVAALLESKPAKADAKKAEAAKPAPVAKAEAPAAPANAARGAAVVQFGAFSSTELAASEWAKLAKAYPSEMSGKGKLVESVERNGKTLFRGAVSGFASRADAVAFCAKLKADGKACIVR